MIETLKRFAVRLILGSRYQKQIVELVCSAKELGLDEYQERSHQTALAINTFLLTPHQVYAGLGLGNEGVRWAG